MPIPTTRQTQMDTFMGHMPAVDPDGYLDNMAFKVNVVAKTADYQVLASESGTYFTDLGTTGTIDFTLPAVAAGLHFTFFSASAGALLVTGAANIMVADNDATATSVQYGSSGDIIGGGFRLFSNGTKWFAMPFGTEAATVTIV